MDILDSDDHQLLNSSVARIAPESEMSRDERARNASLRSKRFQQAKSYFTVSIYRAARNRKIAFRLSIPNAQPRKEANVTAKRGTENLADVTATTVITEDPESFHDLTKRQR